MSSHLKFITVTNTKGEVFEIEEFFSILDDLRESGAINMFGAPRWMVENLDLSKETAMLVWTTWTKEFHPFFHENKDLVIA